MILAAARKRNIEEDSGGEDDTLYHIVFKGIGERFGLKPNSICNRFSGVAVF